MNGLPIPLSCLLETYRGSQHAEVGQLVALEILLMSAVWYIGMGAKSAHRADADGSSRQLSPDLCETIAVVSSRSIDICTASGVITDTSSAEAADTFPAPLMSSR